MTHSTVRFAHLLLAALVTSALLPRAVYGQESESPAYLLTVDPSGIVTGRVAADAELCDQKDPGEFWYFGCALTMGLSVTGLTGHQATDPGRPRHRGDVDGVLRIRPDEFSGFWVGLRAGLTFVNDFEAAPNVGAEFGGSRMLGRNLYLGASIGAKKAFLLNHDVGLDLNPSIRFAAGFAF